MDGDVPCVPVESRGDKEGTGMGVVDLTLAVNYAPAVLCLLRLGLFQFLACVVQPGDEVGGFAMLGMFLWLDRVCFKVYLDGYTNLIFDSNVVLVSVLFSNVVMFVRAGLHDTRVTFLSAIVLIVWVCLCFLLILEPPSLRKAFERRTRLYHVVPAVGTVVLLMLAIRIHAPKEDCGLRFWRAFSFAFLCIGWIYVVGLQQFRTGEQMRDNSSHFLARFAPVLYIPAPLAMVFSLVALVCVVYQARGLFLPGQDSQPDPEQPQMPSQEPQKMDAPDEDLVDMLRKAKSARGQ